MKTILFKNLFIISCVLLVSLPVRAQLTGCKQKDAAAMKNGLLYVVMKKEINEVNKLYNQYLYNNINKYWTFSKFAFVGVDTVDKVIFGKNVYLMAGFDEEIISTNGFINVSSIGIVRGGKPYNSYKHTEEMAWVYVRKDLWDYAARFANMVQVLQNAISWRANAANKKKDIYESFNKVAQLKDSKVLYIERKDLNEKLIDFNKIEKAYKYPVKIVEAEELQKAVDVQDPQVVYMHLTNNRNSSCFFIAAKGGEVVWEHKATINTQIQLTSPEVLQELSAAIDLATGDSTK